MRAGSIEPGQLPEAPGPQGKGGSIMTIKKEMYVIKTGSFYELRQTRFIGITHPHDVCAIARSVDEMHSMVDKHWPDKIDYSRVEVDSHAT
jgi:hypothetical protein